MYLDITSINLKNAKEVKEVEEFLKKFDLTLDNNIDYTIVIKDNDEIKATCSKSKNVFKCFAISDDLRGEGIANRLVTAMNNKLFEEGIYHSFVFTKPENKDIFKGIGYKEVYEVEKVVLLENGIYDINRYLDNLIQKNSINVNTKKAALVMNCNPFTKGHRYLIEKAASENEEVLVFIVEEDKSLFPFDVRFNLVKEGVKDLENVTVIPGGEYIISQATFPSYFLRHEDDVLSAYTRIDAGIFSKYYCPKLNIFARYVGEEPYCNVTNIYNHALQEKLGEVGVEVKVIKRKEYDNNAISASKVRNLIKEDGFNEVKEIVPMVTWEFLNTLEGEKIREKIKVSNSVH